MITSFTIYIQRLQIYWLTMTMTSRDALIISGQSVSADYRSLCRHWPISTLASADCRFALCGLHVTEIKFMYASYLPKIKTSCDLNHAHLGTVCHHHKT